MAANPITVNMYTELLLVKEIFDHVYFHRLLVESESDNTFVCVISDRGFLNNYLKQQPSQTSHLIKHNTPNH